MTKRDLFQLARSIDIYCQTTPAPARDAWPVRWSMSLTKTQGAIREFLQDVLTFAREIPATRQQFDAKHREIMQKWVDKDDKGQPIQVVENGAQIPQFTGENKVEYKKAFDALLLEFPTAQADITIHNQAVEERMGAEVGDAVVKSLIMKVKLDHLGDLKLNDQWARVLEPLIEV